MNKVLVTINSYDFIENGEKLKETFEKYFDTISINSKSDFGVPKNVNFIIPNDYYTGLWNKSVNIAIENNYDWLLFLASDITIISSKIIQIIHYIEDIIKNNSIGIYTFSVDKTSRFAFADLVNTKHRSGLKKTKYIEGFCFLCRTSVLKDMYPVDKNINKYGWALDIQMCKLCHKYKLDVVIDHRVIIHHPKSKLKIDFKLAKKQARDYIDYYDSKNF